jgi:hypothetical protein
MHEVRLLRAVLLARAVTNAVGRADAPAVVRCVALGAARHLEQLRVGHSESEALSCPKLPGPRPLGLIGRRLYVVPSPYRAWMYVALACGFVAFHVTHTSVVYARNFPHQTASMGEGR